MPPLTADLESLLNRLARCDPKDPDGQYKAAIALGSLGEQDSRIVPALISALTEASALVRAHSAEALGKRGAREAVGALTKALDDDYQLVRSYSARALGFVGDESVVPRLTSTLQRDEFFGARAEAAESIGRLCQGSRSAPCEQAKAILKLRREEEARAKGDRYARVVRQIGAALEELDQAIEEMSQQAAGLAEDARRRGDKETLAKVSRFRRSLARYRRLTRQAGSLIQAQVV